MSGGEGAVTAGATRASSPSGWVRTTAWAMPWPASRAASPSTRCSTGSPIGRSTSILQCSHHLRPCVAGTACPPTPCAGTARDRRASRRGHGRWIWHGESSCHELAKRGNAIAVLDINAQAAQRVADEIKAGGGTAIGVGVDVTDRFRVEAAFERVRAELGPVAILVTSAGKVGFGKFAEITVEAWQDIIDVNLTGTFHCCQVALPDMVAAGWGRIVMISSSSAQRGSPYMAHYAAAKGGVITLTRSLANEYAKKGITVNNIPPSSIDTPMARQSQATGNLFNPRIWRSAFRWGTWAPARTSRPPSHSCARTRLASSPVRFWASTAAPSSEHAYDSGAVIVTAPLVVLRITR